MPKIITKTGLDAMRAQRPTPNRILTYDIDGPVQTRVKSNLETERIGRINRGDRRMQDASESFRRNMATKSRAGLPRAHFQAVTQPKKERER